MALERLKRSLREAPVVERGDYDYFVHPVTDCLPLVEPELLTEIAAAIEQRVDLAAADRILTAESMGLHHATALSVETGVPFVAARKRRYGFDGEVAVHQATGYGEGELYLNCVDPDDRLVIVDDVLSTGGTIRALCEAVEETGAELLDAVVVVRRATPPAGGAEPSIPVKSLVDVDVVDGAVVVLE
jgi:adenine phosphoribosyltransferase